MKLWLLKRERAGRDPIYDCFDGFVIRAETEERARELAAEQAADEGAAVWREAARSSCDAIPEHGGEGVLLSDFHAG